MSGVSELLSKVYQSLILLSLDTSLYIAWGAYGVVFVLALCFTLFNKGAKRADKRAFLSFTNAFTAVTLALMLTEKDIPFSLLSAALFWCVGYMLYGLLVLLSERSPARQEPMAAVAVTSAMPKGNVFKPDVPPAKSNVRLDHALSVTEKLLGKELARSDRQEVERIKTTLSALVLKPGLTPEENDRLNENFNTLLKLMAKYNV